MAASTPITYGIYSSDFHFENLSRDQLKLFEALCRGNRENYTIKYPDGSRLECKFN